jgi:hypothetical protein
MATEFCQKCKQSHPGRVCDYDEKGECAETADTPDTGERKRRVPVRDGETEVPSDPDHSDE